MCVCLVWFLCLMAYQPCVCVSIYIYIYHHHHHQVALLAWISLTLSLHPSLSSIAPSRLSRLHPVSLH